MFFSTAFLLHLTSELWMRNYPFYVIDLISFDFLLLSAIYILFASDELFSIIVWDNNSCRSKIRSCIHCWWAHFCYHHFVSSQHLSFGSVFDNKSLSDSLIVNAAFQQTLWSVAPICSGGGVAQGKFDNWLFCQKTENGQRGIPAICDAPFLATDVREKIRLQILKCRLWLC